MEKLFDGSIYPFIYFAGLELHLLCVALPLGAALLLPVVAPFESGSARLLSRILVENLPLALVVAAVAGVVPLIFLPLLHPIADYAAVELLGWLRPCLILPLAAAFGLACLQRTARFRAWPTARRVAVHLLLLACICAVGWIFVSSRTTGTSVELVGAQHAALHSWAGTAALRMLLVMVAAAVGCGLWIIAALPRWQRLGKLSPGERFRLEETILWLILPPALGLPVSSAILVEPAAPGAMRWWLTGCAMLVVVGLLLRLWRLPLGRTLAYAGAVGALAALLLIREAARIANLGDAFDLRVLHRAEARAGEAWFLVSVVLMAAGITLVLHLTGAPPPAPPEPEL